MTIAYDRNVCCNLNETTTREWLVTNGLGGYAAGTIAGMLTRVEHGLLVVPLEDITTPYLLFAKIDEEVIFDERTYYLGTNEYRDGTLNPSGFVHLEAFRLEEGFPVFTYHIGGINGIMLEKRIWMPQGRHTTYIQYRVLRNPELGRSLTRTSSSSHYGRFHEYAEATQHTLTLTLLPFAAFRPHQLLQQGDQHGYFQVQPLHPHPYRQHDEQDLQDASLLPTGVVGCTIRAGEHAQPYHLLAVAPSASQTMFIPTNVWYWNFLRRRDAAAGRAAIDDLYLPGVIRATLWPDDDTVLTVILTTEDVAEQPLRPNQLNTLYQRSIDEVRQLVAHGQTAQRFFGETGEAMQAYPLEPLPITSHNDARPQGQELRTLLFQAAQRFQVNVHQSDKQEQDTTFFTKHAYSVPVVLSDFYTQELRTRDTLIALPGLLLTTRRFDTARLLLRELARHFHQGMLPDYWPLACGKYAQPTYTSVDTSLWFFHALDAYLRATRDYELLDELYYRLSESIDCYVQGNDVGISLDLNDGLLLTQANAKALTWMNAQVEGQPVTPRYGKAVEVNALWYNALALLAEWSRYRLQERRSVHMPVHYQELLERCRQHFQQRFWYAEGGYLYDVVDGPEGNDSSIRPNQLFAITLRYAILHEQYQSNVLDVVTRHLLTPLGLRTLAPRESAYCGHIGVQQNEQQHSLHQGNVWSWLLGAYIDALLTTNGLNGRNHAYQTKEHAPRDLVHEYVWRRGVQLLSPLHKQFYEDLQGMIGGVYDGNAPHHSAYSVASVLCTGELLRVYDHLASMQISYTYGNAATASSTRH